MKIIAALGIGAAFLAGTSTALLASYFVPAESIYVCFVAVFIGLAACALAAGAVALYAMRSERIRVDRLVEVTVDRLLQRRGLELVDPD